MQDTEDTTITSRRSKRLDVALTCYAVEGMYPDDLAYLRDHYNLSYNEERYQVFYEPLASNLMPAIKVAERGGKMDK